MSFVPKFSPDPAQYNRVALEWIELKLLLDIMRGPDMIAEHVCSEFENLNSSIEMLDEIETELSNIQSSYSVLVANHNGLVELAMQAHDSGMRPKIAETIQRKYAKKQDVVQKYQMELSNWRYENECTIDV